MPNWCTNAAIIEHKSSAMIDRIEEACKKDKLLEALRPIPGGEWNYDWCISNWGTKWDASIGYYNRDGNSITISFDSAWSPPIEAYRYAENEFEYSIRGYYIEGGMGFSGEYNNGQDYDCGYPTNKKQVAKYLEECSEEMVVELDLEEYFEFMWG